MNEISTGEITIGTATAADGIELGYRRMGAGPGLIVLHGAMSSGWHHHELAQSLASTFTVYLPDRRGRGLSPEHGVRHGVVTDVADLDALIEATGATAVLGVSSGAIIALQAARRGGSHITRLGIFEPPLFAETSSPAEFLERFDTAVARGNLAAAAAIGMQSGKLGPRLMNALPVWMVSPLIRLGMRMEARQGPGDYVPMSTLVPLLHDDFDIVRECSGDPSVFGDVTLPVLLMGGAASPAYLGERLDALAAVLPQAARVTFPDVGHAVTWNADRGGRPLAVTDRIKGFFG